MLLMLSPNSEFDYVIATGQRRSLASQLGTGAAATVNLCYGTVSRLFVSQFITSSIIFYINYINIKWKENTK
jgi:hypothetical protein